MKIQIEQVGSLAKITIDASEEVAEVEIEEEEEEDADQEEEEDCADCEADFNLRLRVAAEEYAVLEKGLSNVEAIARSLKKERDEAITRRDVSFKDQATLERRNEALENTLDRCRGGTPSEVKSELASVHDKLLAEQQELNIANHHWAIAKNDLAVSHRRLANFDKACAATLLLLSDNDHDHDQRRQEWVALTDTHQFTKEVLRAFVKKMMDA